MKIENFNLNYGDRVVFSNFNLEIKDNEVTCILGNSGVGKTSLVNQIIKLAKNENKTVSVAFQEPRLFNHLTVYENLKLLGYTKEGIFSVLEKVELTGNANSYPNKLSGGEKQRVNLARAILGEQDLLILDEPFSSLDVKLKLNLIKVLVGDKKGVTTLFVTHDIEEALMLSNRIIVLGENTISLDLAVDGKPCDRNYGENTKERQEILSALT